MKNISMYDALCKQIPAHEPKPRLHDDDDTLRGGTHHVHGHILGIFGHKIKVRKLIHNCVSVVKILTLILDTQYHTRVMKGTNIGFHIKRKYVSWFLRNQRRCHIFSEMTFPKSVCCGYSYCAAFTETLVSIFWLRFWYSMINMSSTKLKGLNKYIIWKLALLTDRIRVAHLTCIHVMEVLCEYFLKVLNLDWGNGDFQVWYFIIANRWQSQRLKYSRQSPYHISFYFTILVQKVFTWGESGRIGRPLRGSIPEEVVGLPRDENITKVICGCNVKNIV